MFSQNNSLLLIVDLQQRLLPKILDSTNVLNNTIILAECCKILNLPILITEQYPEGIGPTTPELTAAVGRCAPITKRTFSCCREERFMKALDATGRKQIVMAGIEAHVCVFQTAADLIQRGFQVQVIADATGSRSAFNREIGLERIKAVGARISSVESVVFELLETSLGEQFKEILRRIK